VTSKAIKMYAYEIGNHYTGKILKDREKRVNNNI
jgi:hypothetical protein